MKVCATQQNEQLELGTKLDKRSAQSCKVPWQCTPVHCCILRAHGTSQEQQLSNSSPPGQLLLSLLVSSITASPALSTELVMQPLSVAHKALEIVIHLP